MSEQDEINEFVVDLGKGHPEYSLEQFKAEFKAIVGRDPKMAEARLFQKTVIEAKNAKLAQSSSSSPSLTVKPIVINGYTFGEVLGKGSFGEVFKCRKGDAEYAVKRIDESVMAATAEKDFADSVSARLNCKFLVSYIEKFRDAQGALLVAMELCPKGNLRMVIDKLRELDASLNIARVMKIFVQLLVGLYVLHGHKILHRDLKPENVFVDSEDNAKLGDFGCAKQLDTTSRKANTMIGTPVYEAPEVIKGEEYDASADMWALGVVLYELLTLERPFSHPNRYQLQGLIIAGKYTDIPKERCSKEIAALVRGLLSVIPKNRPSASSLLQNSLIRKYAAEFDLLKYFPNASSPSSSYHELPAAQSRSLVALPSTLQTVALPPRWSAEHKADAIVLSNSGRTACCVPVECVDEDMQVSVAALVCEARTGIVAVSMKLERPKHFPYLNPPRPPFNTSFFKELNRQQEELFQQLKPLENYYDPRPLQHNPPNQEVYRRIDSADCVVGLFTHLIDDLTKFSRDMYGGCGVFYSSKDNEVFCNKSERIASTKKFQFGDTIKVEVDTVRSEIRLHINGIFAARAPDPRIVQGGYVVGGFHGYRNFFPRWTILSVEHTA